MSCPSNRQIPLPKIVSLFSGAGGLDYGFAREGFEVAVAFDISSAAIKTHRRNFPLTLGIAGDLTKLKPSGVLKHVLGTIPRGARIGVIGGPPCQGFSRANTGATAGDPRNSLPKLYVKIVRFLQHYYQVEFVVFENVLGMRDRKHAATYSSLVRGLRALGLSVTEKELCALDFGVPQTRRRIVLSGLRQGLDYAEFRPRKRTGLANVREAIGNVPPPVFFAPGLQGRDIPVHPNHWTMNSTLQTICN